MRAHRPAYCEVLSHPAPPLFTQWLIIIPKRKKMRIQLTIVCLHRDNRLWLLWWWLGERNRCLGGRCDNLAIAHASAQGLARNYKHTLAKSQIGDKEAVRVKSIEDLLKESSGEIKHTVQRRTKFPYLK
jgi:hypothetical protein